MKALFARPTTHRLWLFVGLVVILGAGCSRQQAENQAAEAPPEQISADDVQVAGLRLSSGDGGNSFQVAGQVQNNSPTFTLTALQLKVVMQDCLETGVCEVLGEDVAEIGTSVPAGQSRDFQVDAHFGKMRPPQGRLGWHYSIVEVKGTKP